MESTNNDDNQLSDLHEQIILAMEQTMSVHGLSQSVGRIYGILYVAKEPMSFQKIQDVVGMSRASINNGLRTLVDSGSVVKIWSKEERKNYYSAEKDFYKNFPAFIIHTLRNERMVYMRMAEQVKQQLMELSEHGNEEVKNEAQRNLEDMDHALHFYRWLSQFTDLLESGDIYRFLPKNVPDHSTK